MSMQDNPFIKETIEEKKEPYYRKLLKTIGLGLGFGAAAALVFFLLRPLIGAGGKEKADTVVILQEATTEAEVETTVEPETEAAAQPTGQNTQPSSEAAPTKETQLDEQEILRRSNRAVTEMVNQAEKSLATLNITYPVLDEEFTLITTGALFAVTGTEYCFLAERAPIYEGQMVSQVLVTFSNGVTVEGSVKGEDIYAGFAVYTVPYTDELAERVPAAVPLETASSKNVQPGELIAAVGSPTGKVGSLAIGHVSYIEDNIAAVDRVVQLISLDAARTEGGKGFLLNSKGQLVGVFGLDSEYDQPTITGVGISSLTNLIEKVSNQDSMAFLGIVGEGVPADTELPRGVFVSRCIQDSPAYEAGIQSGDIITRINNTPMLTFSDFQMLMEDARAGSRVLITVARSGRDEYREYTYEIVLSERRAVY